MAKRRRKNRTHVRPTEAEDTGPKHPKSFVLRSGPVGKAVTILSRDLRKVMEPNTATKLKERKNNKLKDFVHVAGQLGVTHYMIFSRTDTGTNLRIARNPRGPTLTFRVLKYSLIKDVLRLQKTPKSPGSEYRSPPLLVLNNFGGDAKETKLMTSMFQNLFPPINVQNMHLNDARRVVLLNYNSETGTIDFRHYCIGVKPIGVTKGVKKIITSELPRLGKFEDISEYVLREAFASESDVEDGPESTVTLAQNYHGRNNRKSEQRAIRLTELGPRLELKLTKIQEGLCEGAVLYHSFIHKTPEEIKAQEKARQKKKQEVALRRKQQEINVEKKKAAAEAHKVACGASTSQAPQENDSESEDDIKEHSGDDDGEDDDDEELFNDEDEEDELEAFDDESADEGNDEDTDEE
ncbi:Brix-domain-containing protein [Basidiobolus meristosporus CBS 931.73]|uniref:Brix-domain-containing protein n=1 Tax=Basidiobolus meristosporus CBS 931.73 TaxID=1314790 RepID=A0A1Y1XXI1_9FUNG|nr:Brix-domain-containing protein [Basidiobolus meristosporus CBS 931.73]|eukprot:ORX90365.1 Brix-domain-containing protein [Basidiobolus meristosporus CBS 931.73]